MSEKLFSSGSGDDSDPTHWDRGVENNEGTRSMYVGRHGDEGSHCHYGKTSSGKEFVSHRGHCKVCDDDRQNISGADWDGGGSDGGDGLPSGSSHGRGRLLLSLACVAVFGFTLF